VVRMEDIAIFVFALIIIIDLAIVAYIQYEITKLKIEMLEEIQYVAKKILEILK
jgi:hypothetical protein